MKFWSGRSVREWLLSQPETTEFGTVLTSSNLSSPFYQKQLLQHLECTASPPSVQELRGEFVSAKHEVGSTCSALISARP